MGATALQAFTARAGVRLAIIQALIVVTAFGLAGVMTHIAVDRLETSAMREHIRGEVRSLEEEQLQYGPRHLPHTVTKRTRLWRGFAYGLATAAGDHLAGALPTLKETGWTSLEGVAGADEPAHRPFLVFSEHLADGSRLSVGQDLSARIKQSQALTWMLLLCGACGVGVCVAASTIFSLRVWRQLDALSTVARKVQDGRLEMRVPARRGGVRNDDLDELGVTFNAMLDRIGLLISQVRQVSTDIAHDLRTPVTRVRMRLERLREGLPASGPSARELHLVEEDLDEILRTFDALLQLGELGAGASTPKNAIFDLEEAALRVAHAFRPDLEDGGRSLVTATAPTAVYGDERLVAQALSNLLENAMRYTPQGATVALTVQAAPQPRLTVADNGPGIPESRRADVLRPLFRLDSSRHLPGSGVGLSIVAAVAARHKATLTLEDAAPGLRVSMRFASAP